LNFTRFGMLHMCKNYRKIIDFCYLNYPSIQTTSGVRNNLSFSWFSCAELLYWLATKSSSVYVPRKLRFLLNWGSFNWAFKVILIGAHLPADQRKPSYLSKYKCICMLELCFYIRREACTGVGRDSWSHPWCILLIPFPQQMQRTIPVTEHNLFWLHRTVKARRFY